MVTTTDRPDSDDAGRDRVLRSANDSVSSRSSGDAERVLDSYAKAELERRHERTESIIRKAREQFL